MFFRFASQVTAVAATGDTISAFGAKDQIDLAFIAFGANTTLGYAPNNSNTGGTLTVDDHNGDVASIALLGQYLASSFVLASGGHGGTVIPTDPPAAQMIQLASSHA